MANNSSDDLETGLEERVPDARPSGADRRLTPRHPLKLGVRFSTAQELATAVRASTSNIGLGGLCLLTRRAYESGTELMLKIELGAGEVLEVVAVVAWARPGKAIGVRFAHMTDDDRARLQRLVGKAEAPPGEPG